MRFGVGVLGDMPIPSFRSYVRLVEGLGYDELWVADQRFLRDVYPLLAIAALDSSRLHIGSAVSDPFSRHPAITAAAIATIAEIAGGRSMLGMGVGAAGFPAMGLSVTRPVDAVRDAVSLIRRLLRGESVDVQSPSVYFKGSLDFTPSQDVPIVIAARGPRMFELAGEIADQVMIGSYVSERTLAFALHHISVGAARSGRDPNAIPKVIWTYLAVGENRMEARDRVKTGVAAAVWTSRSALEKIGMAIPAELGSILDREGYNLSDAALVSQVRSLVPDSFVDDMALAGTIEDVAAGMERVFQMGIDGILLWPFPQEDGEPDHDLALVARDAIPRIRRLYSGR